MIPRRLVPLVLVGAAAAVLAGCASPVGGQSAPAGTSSTVPASSTTAPPSTTSTSTRPATTTTAATTKAPVWLVGAHPLPLRPDGFGQVLPTPAALVNRSLPTNDLLPPPTGGRYAATISAVPQSVLTRSTWKPGCPVAATELRYLTMSFWGFDGRAHTGEMIVNASVAGGVTTAFGRLFAARFAIEEMRVTAAPELTAAPTGDGNNTTAFVCRPTVGQTNWSAHAYGLAIDVDPFCNPYTKGDLVLPELASSYLDRGNVRAGMVLRGGVAVTAFAAVGFSWGGDWTSPRDLQHFTATGH